MSFYANVDDEDAGQVATNAGWFDFARWVSLLDGPTALRDLTEDGITEDGTTLAADLSGAIEGGSPTPDQQSIAEGLLAIAERMEPGAVLTVTDGVGVALDAKPADGAAAAAVQGALESVATTDEARAIIESLRREYP